MRVMLVSLAALALASCQTITEQESPSTEQSKFVVETIPAEYETQTLSAYVKNATTEYLNTSPFYETAMYTVVVEPASFAYEVIPGEYKWVDGEIPGQSLGYEYIPAEFERYTETIVVQPAEVKYIKVPPICERAIDGGLVIVSPVSYVEKGIPAVTKPSVRWRISTPAQIIEKFVPNEIRDGKTRILVTRSKVVEKPVPAVTRQVSRKVIKMSGPARERVIPAGERELTCRFVKTPGYYLVRNRAGEIIQKLDSDEALAEFQANSKTTAKE